MLSRVKRRAALNGNIRERDFDVSMANNSDDNLMHDVANKITAEVQRCNTADDGCTSQRCPSTAAVRTLLKYSEFSRLQLKPKLYNIAA